MRNSIETKAGKLTLRREAVALLFVCGRCGKRKTSKNVADWVKPDNTTVCICNGCYGEMLAKGGLT